MSSRPFSLVPSVKEHLNTLSLDDIKPILLEGMTGCGKTRLVEYLADRMGRKLVKLQLGDQTDSKSMLGNYCCSEVPGRFFWRNGAILEAMIAGDWLLLEDLDQSAADVLCALVPLLESGSLLVPGLGNSQVVAKSGFRIFATSRLMETPSGYCRVQTNAQFGIVLKHFVRIVMEPMNSEELISAIKEVYPSLASSASKIVEIFKLLQQNKFIDQLQSDSGGGDSVSLYASKVKQFTMRDLMKWCHRLANKNLTKEVACFEAFDVFAMSLPEAFGRLSAFKKVVETIGHSPVFAEQRCLHNQPEVKITDGQMCVGRFTMAVLETNNLSVDRAYGKGFAFTRHSSCLLEGLAGCVTNEEPVLLVGETGTGKTSVVQFLADNMRANLHVINMNQQSDSSDLLGGYRPVDLKVVFRPFLSQYEQVFSKSFSRSKNVQFFHFVEDLFRARKWSDLFAMLRHPLKNTSKRVKTDPELVAQWQAIEQRIDQLEVLVEEVNNAPAFSFVEGVLIESIRRGDWVLLDEINLATAETLESLSGLIESTEGSVILSDRGDLEPIPRHKNFRLFACMNPAVDVGKKDLPIGFRNRFTEFYVDEVTDDRNLSILVNDYLKGGVTTTTVSGIVKFYQEVRERSRNDLCDGVGGRPHFSMRALCRALRVAKKLIFGDLKTSLYEAFSLSFLTQLDRKSYLIVAALIEKFIPKTKSNKRPLISSDLYVECQGYVIKKGDREPVTDTDYILTPSVISNLKDLARVVASGLPVLIQGETSVGKTSLISYLARLTGNRCFRINNHEHTDVQEYIGMHTADKDGRLIFKEGILVEAMRKGHWIILDELNLAPTDVLEALNRLLDDNRELFIPETQETVKAHEKFLLFATQNPPGFYGGRKVLSRAFRNRFVELHFDELPSAELEVILHKRGSLSRSHSEKLVAIMLELQMKRLNSGVFVGKHGFITLRELFRWAERYRLLSHGRAPDEQDWDQLLADMGFMLLAGRVRFESEEQLIKETIEKHLKRKVDPERLYSSVSFALESVGDESFPEVGGCGVVEPGQGQDSNSKKNKRKMKKLKLKEEKEAKLKAEVDRKESRSDVGKSFVVPGFEHVVMTKAMMRMATLVWQAIKFNEPILLVGETGCGKTTICQMLAKWRNSQLMSINCHLHTESSDFLGGLRPVRHREGENSNRLFEWCDGPLVKSMKTGATFLVDEISLADDSILERLNSVLEPERTLLLVEKGGSGDDAADQSEEIVAAPEFRLVATMNPGGDYGKKELSLALRNRFTEIWCPLSRERLDWMHIIEHNLRSDLSSTLVDNEYVNEEGFRFGSKMAEFVEWLAQQAETRRVVVSIRDLLSWTNFINVTSLGNTDGSVEGFLSPVDAYVHGALLVFIDALQPEGSGIKMRCLEYLTRQNEADAREFISRQSSLSDDDARSGYFKMGSFKIAKGPEPVDQSLLDFAFNAPTTATNTVRVMRALQVRRPILLEGSPGVGKTSLLLALAKASGHQIVRINLSDQTDITDLFGADLPVDGGKCGEFRWRDGPLLAGLKAGHWIVLDELNLATQSVLEGLNACFDHRSEVFIPELNQSFRINHEKTRIFACQNPVAEGGDRKGLPKSFLNRFTQVYVDQLTREDLLFVLRSVHPDFPERSLELMVEFNQKIHRAVNVEKKLGQVGGASWDFNLRDLMRWCQLCIQNSDLENPENHVDLMYVMRFRSNSDRCQVVDIFEEVFKQAFSKLLSSPDYHFTDATFRIGNAFVSHSNDVARTPGVADKGDAIPLRILQKYARPLSALIQCIQMNWMTILVGPSGSGKTCALRLAAELADRKLHTVSMNSGMDTTELLGSFEQVTFLRKLKKFIERTSSEIDSLAESVRTESTEHIGHLWNEFKKFEKEIVQEKENRGESKLALRYLGDMLSVACMIGNDVPGSDDDDVAMEEDADSLRENASLRAKACRLEKTIREMHACCGLTEGDGGRFEWVDSLLVTCMKEGHWIVLDNINFCSSSVLDRLNGVLEPNGKLRLDELGTVDGLQVPEVTPHPDFRLFLTMDPKNGDISRAMRNRGVEICLTSDEHNMKLGQEDLIGLLHDTNMPPPIIKSILRFHELATADPEVVTEIPWLVKTCELAKNRLNKVAAPVSVEQMKVSLRTTFELVYVRSCHDKKLRLKLTDLIEKSLSVFDPYESSSSGDCDVSVVPLPNLNRWFASVDGTAVERTMILFKRIFLNYLKRDVIPPLSFDVQSESDFALALGGAYKHAVQANTIEGIARLPEYLKSVCSPFEAKLIGSTIQPILEAIFENSNFIAQHWLTESFLKIAKNKQLPMDACLNRCHARSLTEEQVSGLFKVYRQMFVVMSLRMAGYQVGNNLSTVEPIRQKLKPDSAQSCSLVQLAASYKKGFISKDRLPSLSIPAFAKFISLVIDEMIASMSQSMQELSCQSLNDVSEGLCWFNALVGRLTFKMEDERIVDELLMDASLLWRLVDKKLVATFERLTDSKFSETFADLLANLRRTLNSRIDKLHVAVVTAFGRVPIFKDQSGAELYLKLKALLNKHFEMEDRLLRFSHVKVKDITAWLRFFGNADVVKAIRWISGLIAGMICGSDVDEISVAQLLSTESALQKISSEVFIQATDRDCGDDPDGKTRPSLESKQRSSLYLQPVKDHFLSMHSAGVVLGSPSRGKSSASFGPLAEYSCTAVLSSSISCLSGHSSIYGILNHHQEQQGNDLDLFELQLIGSHLFSLKPRLSSGLLPRLLGATESTSQGKKQGEDEDDENGYEGDEEEMLNIAEFKKKICFSTFSCRLSQLVLDILNPNRSSGAGKESKATRSVFIVDSAQQENCSWLLSTFELQHAQRKLDTCQRLERHLWSFFANDQLDTWNALLNSMNLLDRTLLHLCKSLVSFLPDDGAMVGHETEDFVETFVQRAVACASDELRSIHPRWSAEVWSAYDHLQKAKRRFRSATTGAGSYWLVAIEIGMAWLYLGIVRLNLVRPREGSVDHVRKVKVQLEGVRQMIHETEIELNLRLENEKIHRGSTASSSGSSELLDGIGCDGDSDVVRLIERISQLKVKEDKLEKRLAFRPFPSQYPSLCREVSQFVSSTMDSDKVATIAERLYGSVVTGDELSPMIGLDHSSVQKCVNDLKNFSSGASIFSEHLEQGYALYRDEIVNVVSALRQCEFGLDAMTQVATARLSDAKMSKELSMDAGDVVRILTTFPTAAMTRIGDRIAPSLIDLVERMLSGDFQILISRVEAKKEFSFTGRILKCCSELLLNCHLSSSCGSVAAHPSTVHSRRFICLLGSLATTYVTRWNKQEQERREREEEEASLYRFRSSTKLLSEEETDAAEVLRDFPNFSEDFIDIDKPDALNDPAPASVTAPGDGDRGHARPKEKNDISESDFYRFASVLTKIFTNECDDDEVDDCKSSKKKPTKQKDVKIDWFTYWNSTYQMASEILLDASQYLDPSLERNILTNHLMAACTIQSSLATGEANPSRETNKVLNVYKEADTKNAPRCVRVLTELKSRVETLLEEWPKHNTLVQLLIIIERILSFPVSSPPMRFTRGLEILLEAAQVWQDNAARHVSLAPQLEEVTRLMKAWRGMELKGWKACLDSLEEEARRQSQKWWYHIHSIVQPHLASQSDLEKETKVTILASLQELLENSPLGEFQPRLKIVLSFHRYLSCVSNCREDRGFKSTAAIDSLVRIFGNVHSYYKQFSESIGDLKDRSREPIEKELKNYLKIVSRMKDEDVNYFSVRSTCQRSHRTVHKFTKQYRLHLQQPVKPMLVDKLVDWQADKKDDREAIDKKSKSKKSTEKEAEGVALNPKMFLVDTVKCDQDQQHPRLKKMVSFCEKMFSQSVISKSINGIASFTGSILETVSHLQSMTPQAGLPKEKRLKELKYIQNLKKKSLVDLFKVLRVMGLSHKKGLANIDSTPHQESMLLWFTATPMPHALPDMDTANQSSKDYLSGQLKKCKVYLTRCFARRSLLLSLLANHNKELDGNSVARCRGFPENLQMEVMSQREKLVENMEAFAKLSFALSDVANLSSVSSLPSQSACNEWKNKTRDLSRTSSEFLHQLMFYVDTILSSSSPQQQGGVDDDDDKFLSLVTPDVAVGAKKRRSNAEKAKELIKKCLDCLSCMNAKYSSSNEMSVSLAPIAESFSKLEGVAKDMRRIDQLLSPVELSDELSKSGLKEIVVSSSTLVESIFCGCREFVAYEKEVENACQKGEGELMDVVDGGLASPELDQFKEECRRLATRCLKSLECLFKEEEEKKQKQKKEKKEQEMIKDDGGCEKQPDELDGDDDDEDAENLLTGLNVDLSSTFKILKLPKVANKLSLLLKTVSDWSDQPLLSNHIKEAIGCFSYFRDVLTQYGRLVQFYITQQVSGLRELSKLNSVLLRLFAELAEKGYCTPPELTSDGDDAKDSKGTKFEDIEEGGMDEGEGIRDVSEQIEDEGQIEGLQSDKKPDKKEDKEDKEEDEGEDKAIEIGVDFDAELTDPRKQDDEDENEDNDDNGDEPDIDKQMGDVGDDVDEKLDEKMWGDDEEEEEDDNKENKSDDHGKGTNVDQSQELGCKGSAEEGDKEDEKSKEEDKVNDDDDEEKESKANHVPDYSEYDEEVDEKKPEKNHELPEEEDMEIPENLNLDGDDADPAESTENADMNVEESSKTEDVDDKDDVDENKDVDGDEDDKQMDIDEAEGENKDGGDDAGDDDDDGGDHKAEDMEAEESEDVSKPGIEPQLDESNKSTDENDNKQDDEAKEKSDDAIGTHHDTKSEAVTDMNDTAGTSQVELESQDTESRGGYNRMNENSRHQDDSVNKYMTGSAKDDKKPESRKRQRETNEDRSLGTSEESAKKRLKTVDCNEGDVTRSKEEDEINSKEEESTYYSHMKESSAEKHDAQVYDSATQEQLQKQQPVDVDTEKAYDDANGGDDVQSEEDDDKMNVDEIPELQPKPLKNASTKKNPNVDQADPDETKRDSDETNLNTEGDYIQLNTVARGLNSVISCPSLVSREETDRKEQEEFKRKMTNDVKRVNNKIDQSQNSEMQKLWQTYEASTSQLSQDLCEQLRLILEPTQASKLRGDYRTGKRISMRKVIQYVASQFRKDRIWLRRTRPSKRQYRVMLAIDDSRSMFSNNSKELAFESLAVITSALTKLEVGQLGLCSFGEEVKVLHPFGKPFTPQSGAELVQNLTFGQNLTNFIEMLQTVTGLFSEQNYRQPLQQAQAGASSAAHQLLIVLSDGIIQESTSEVLKAVRCASDCKVFIVFVIIDSVDNRDSIFDRKSIQTDHNDKLKIVPYMDSFPFPFYSVIRDVKKLPQTLADALRQWFELIAG